MLLCEARRSCKNCWLDSGQNFYHLYVLQLGTSCLAYRYTMTISRSGLSMRVIGSMLGSNEFYKDFTSVCLYVTEAYLKCEGYLKFRSRLLKCQGQFEGNKFSIYCKCFVLYVLCGWYTFDWKAFSSEHIFVFVICNLFLNWKLKIEPFRSDHNTNIQYLFQELDL